MTSFSFRSAPCSRVRPALAHVSCPLRDPSGAAARTSGCSASGERLVSATRDGNAIDARMLLELSSELVRYSTFGGLNTPLHFVAAKGHLEIVTMLLEKGVDVNSRNYCGQVNKYSFSVGQDLIELPRKLPRITSNSEGEAGIRLDFSHFCSPQFQSHHDTAMAHGKHIIGKVFLSLS